MDKVKSAAEVPTPRLTELETENARLQQMVAELLMRNQMLREQLQTKSRDAA